VAQNITTVKTTAAPASANLRANALGCPKGYNAINPAVIAVKNVPKSIRINAHAYEEMPFDVLGEELKKCGQAPPDLRAIFTFETFSERSSRLGDLEVDYRGIAARNTMPWRFQMRVRDEGGAFSGLARFDARLHDPYLVRRMMRNYVRLLEAVVRKPAARLCDVEEELGNR